MSKEYGYSAEEGAVAEAVAERSKAKQAEETPTRKVQEVPETDEAAEAVRAKFGEERPLGDVFGDLFKVTAAPKLQLKDYKDLKRFVDVIDSHTRNIAPETYIRCPFCQGDRPLVLRFAVEDTTETRSFGEKEPAAISVSMLSDAEVRSNEDARQTMRQHIYIEHSDRFATIKKGS